MILVTLYTLLSIKYFPTRIPTQKWFKHSTTPIRGRRSFTFRSPDTIVHAFFVFISHSACKGLPFVGKLRKPSAFPPTKSVFVPVFSSIEWLSPRFLALLSVHDVNESVVQLCELFVQRPEVSHSTSFWF